MPPAAVIDLRDTVVCASCGEPLALWQYNGDPGTLRCSDCTSARVTTVEGRATSTTYAADTRVDA